MTDYRDFDRPGYLDTDPAYTGRPGGSTGILVALGIIALLAIALFAFAGSGTTTATSDGVAPIAPTTQTAPADNPAPAVPVPAEPAQ